MSKKEKFFDVLKNIFVGAKVEGESGYINLIRIKSRYYEKGVFPKLQQDINKATESFPKFREELFDKLYTFFESYFSESGSIYFRYTPIHKNVYEKIYTDDKDVMLFWKTHMLYYVKTERLFKSLEVRLPAEINDDESEDKVEYKFFFDVSTLQHKKANEKREIIYEFKEIRKDKVPVFNVFYSERGRITKLKEIIKALKKENIKINEDILEQAFKVFEKQSEVDYFINKNAREFLREQFNMWLYQYVFSGESDWTEKRIKQIQVLKEISFKIIDFISQFEDELVRIWNKPKFVMNSNYVITLDRIAKKFPSMKVWGKFPSERGDKGVFNPNADTPLDTTNPHTRSEEGNLIEKIIKHPNINEQIDEWKELGIIDNNFDKDEIVENNLTGKHLNFKYKYFPIDTKYFKDLEIEILALFDDLDNSLDGWLIKSENYQALNTILPKFKEKVQTIYIDPPFNLDSSDQFLYRTNYKDANWATLLENRLQLAKEWLNKKGNIFVRCDYNGNWVVRPIMDCIFKSNFQNEIILNRFKKKSGVLTTTTESLFLYSKADNIKFNKIQKPRKCIYCKQEIKPEWQWSHSAGESNIPRYFTINGKPVLLYPPKGRHWTNKQETIHELEENGRIRINHNTSYTDTQGNRVNFIPEKLQSQDTEIDSNWTDIPGYEFGVFSVEKFSTQNSEELLERVVLSGSDEGDFVFDFFLGSGTTIALSRSLARKWLGVEMGEHFYDVVVPRMKRVLANKKNEILNTINNYKGGGFFKYYELEQYEDTLRKVKYKDTDLFDNSNQTPFNQYVFMKDTKLLDALEVDYENNKVKVDFAKLYSDIDIPETLSNLLGKWIKKITPEYVEFEDGEKVNINNMDYKIIKPLIWW